MEVVKNQPFGLITNILTLDVSKDTFTKIKELYDSNNNNKNKNDSSLAYATYYFYINALSVINKMTDFNSNAKQTLFSMLPDIYMNIHFFESEKYLLEE